MELVLLNQITWCQLKQKHQQGKETDFNTFIANTPELLKRLAVRTRDEAGPSRIDADIWRKSLTVK